MSGYTSYCKPYKLFLYNEFLETKAATKGIDVAVKKQFFPLGNALYVQAMHAFTICSTLNTKKKKPPLSYEVNFANA